MNNQNEPIVNRPPGVCVPWEEAKNVSAKYKETKSKSNEFGVKTMPRHTIISGSVSCHFDNYTTANRARNRTRSASHRARRASRGKMQGYLQSAKSVIYTFPG
jgi:hypothetical protein